MPKVFVVGQTGCGKSSVINLIAGEKKAPTSLGDDLSHCTKTCKEYPIVVNDRQFQVFDTFGFLEPDLDPKLYAEAIADTYRAISAGNGIDMVLYCVRDDKIDDKKTKSNYKLVRKVLCDEEVPIALVVTTRGNSALNGGHYESIFAARNVSCVDYVCANITGTSGPNEPMDTRSQEAIRQLLVKCCGSPGSRSTLQQVSRGVKGLVGRGQFLGEKRVSTLLTQRCNMNAETAKLVIEALRPQLSSNRLRRAPYARATTPGSSSQKASVHEELQRSATTGTSPESQSPESAVDNAALPSRTDADTTVNQL